MNSDPEEAPIVSSDDEIDYSVKPEFYDPDMDSKDESWVHNRIKRGPGGSRRPSDAVLSCPACFTTLCFESQRHDTVVTRYRAVFVVNCRLKPEVAMRTQPSRKGSRSHRSGKRKHEDKEEGGAVMGGEAEEVELFKPVCCEVCDTNVGFMDRDEVYHFLDAIPSEA